MASQPRSVGLSVTPFNSRLVTFKKCFSVIFEGPSILPVEIAKCNEKYNCVRNLIYCFCTVVIKRIPKKNCWN